MTPDVTVVITTRDRCALLRASVASVQAQEGVAVQLIVADDGSTDGTAHWLASTAIEVVGDGRARGRCRTSAFGLEAARGRYLMFFDDDDRMLPGALARLCAALDAEPSAVAAIGGRLRMHEGRLQRTNHPARPLTRRAGPEMLAGWSVTPGQVLMRREAAVAPGGLPAWAWPCDDRALQLALARQGPIAFVPEAVHEYGLHADQATRKPYDFRALRLRVWRHAIAELPAAEQRAARCALVAGRHWRGGDAAVMAGRSGRALWHYAAVLVLAPRVATSPLVWPPLARGVLAALRPGVPRGTRPW